MGKLWRDPVSNQHLVKGKVNRQAMLHQSHYTREQAPGRAYGGDSRMPACEQDECQTVHHESDGGVGGHGIEGWPDARQAGDMEKPTDQRKQTQDQRGATGRDQQGSPAQSCYVLVHPEFSSSVLSAVSGEKSRAAAHPHGNPPLRRYVYQEPPPGKESGKSRSEERRVGKEGR